MDRWLKRRVIDCPVCGEAFGSDKIQSHAATCGLAPEVPKVGDEIGSGQEGVTEQKTPKLSSDLKSEGPGKSIGAVLSNQKPVNAFERMKVSAAAVPRKEMFNCTKKLETEWVVKGEQSEYKDKGSWSSETSEKFPWKTKIDLNKNVNLGDPNHQRAFRGTELLVCSEVPGIEENEFGRAVADAACSSPVFREAFKNHGAFWSSNRNSSRLSVGVLKSLLQKSVRRGMASSALFCTAELLVRDRNEFFRRMPIIVVEDSILHPELDFLVWLMLVCSKGFIPNSSLLRKCFGIVLQVAVAKKNDVIGFGQVPRDVASIDATLLENMNILPSKGKALIRSLLCRASFGGMGGDRRMLIRHACFWVDRFLSTEDKGAWIIALEKYHQDWCRSLSPCTEVTIPVAGIDFHCSPWILEQVEHREVHPDVLRSSMWHFHSSVNVREFLGDDDFNGLRTETAIIEDNRKRTELEQQSLKAKYELEEVWNRIKDQVLKICTDFLASKCPAIKISCD